MKVLDFKLRIKQQYETKRCETKYKNNFENLKIRYFSQNLSKFSDILKTTG